MSMRLSAYLYSRSFSRATSCRMMKLGSRWKTSAESSQIVAFRGRPLAPPSHSFSKLIYLPQQPLQDVLPSRPFGCNDGKAHASPYESAAQSDPELWDNLGRVRQRYLPGHQAHARFRTTHCKPQLSHRNPHNTGFSHAGCDENCASRVAFCHRNIPGSGSLGQHHTPRTGAQARSIECGREEEVT